MPRFSPWSSNAPPDQDADPLMEDTLRPNLRKAFPLPSDDGPSEERFRQVLAALAQRGARAVKARH